MYKFTYAQELPKGDTKVDFRTEIDNDGDFLIYANGILIACFDCKDGCLGIIGNIKKDCGLPLNEEGFLLTFPKLHLLKEANNG